MIEIRYYRTRDGEDIVREWLVSLKDKRTRAKIDARLDRLAAGNFGDHKSLRKGLYELRINWGPGYRGYYTLKGNTCVLLLCGGIEVASVRISVAHLNFLRTFRAREKRINEDSKHRFT